MTKKELFKKKIGDVQISIWELEFKIFKTREIREGVRQDRDRALEHANNLKIKIPTLKDKAEKKKTEEQMAGFLDNAKRYEAQMKMLDDQVNGVPASGENPGQQGLLDTMESLSELKLMYTQYVKKMR